MSMFQINLYNALTSIVVNTGCILNIFQPSVFTRQSTKHVLRSSKNRNYTRLTEQPIKIVSNGCTKVMTDYCIHLGAILLLIKQEFGTHVYGFLLSNNISYMYVCLNNNNYNIILLISQQVDLMRVDLVGVDLMEGIHVLTESTDDVTISIYIIIKVIGYQFLNINYLHVHFLCIFLLCSIS